MADLEQKTMNDICESTDNNTAPKLPSQDTAAEETLWKKSMNRILVGITLTAITLNFGLLNYIFPTIGTMLLLFGFRALQHENKWFKRCFIISIIRTAYFFWMLIWNTTILHSTIYSSQICFYSLRFLFVFGRAFSPFGKKPGFLLTQAAQLP